MQITVPMGGTNVIPEGEGPSRHPADAPSPLAQRKSLHTVRMGPTTTPEYKPEWKENGQLKWVPQEAAEPEPAAEEQVVESPVPRGSADAGAQPYESLTREIAELKQTMQLMAQNQLQPQQPQGPQPPDPEQFDFYEPAQVAEFHRKNNEYIQWTVQQTVQTALDPHRDAMREAEYTRQYNSVLGDYGRLADGSENPNFKPLMTAALQLVAKSMGANGISKFTIPEAYDIVASSQITSPQTAATTSQPVARPAHRTLTEQEAAQKAAQARSLPPRNGVSGSAEPGLPAALQTIGSLGRIMFHNQQTGRARPI